MEAPAKLLLIGFSALALTSCGDNNPTLFHTKPKPAQIAVSTDSLNFGTMDTQLALGVYNAGDGSVSWSMSITSGVSWISIQPTTADTTVDTTWVTVTVDRGAFGVGDYTGSLDIVIV